MTISVKCACGAGYRLKPEAAGKKIQCRECDAILTIPSPRRPAAPKELSDDDFEGDPEFEDYEDDEDADEQPVRGGERFSSANGRHRIELLACETSVERIAPKPLQKICDELLNYFTSSPRVFKSSEIRLSVRTKMKDAVTASFQLTARGSLNGRAFEKSVNGVTSKYVSNAAAGAASGGIVGALVGVAMDRRAMKQGRPNPALQQEFSKARFKLFEACDKVVGRKPSKASGRWLGVQIASGVAAVIAALVFFLIVKLRGETVLSALMSAATIIVPAGAGVLAAGLTFMPDAFFLRDAAGRRALHLSGASSPSGARLVGGITAVLMLALTIGIAILFVKLNK